MYVTQGSTEYEFILERAPLESLVIDGQVKTAYTITSESRIGEQKFLVATKSPSDQLMQNEVTVTNFDDRFYQNDKDIINNLI